MSSLPEMKNVVIGDTEYLDRVKLADFPEQSRLIAQGTDRAHRTFVTFAVRTTDGKTNKVVDEAIYTAFQRYTYNASVMVMCRSHEDIVVDGKDKCLTDLLGMQTVMNEAAWAYVDELCDTGKHIFTGANDGQEYVTTVVGKTKEEE
jgi:hypothetical protein